MATVPPTTEPLTRQLAAQLALDYLTTLVNAMPRMNGRQCAIVRDALANAVADCAAGGVRL